MVMAMAMFAPRAGASEVDHLKVVRAYADVLLDKGRDRTGKVHSPLIAAALDRKTLSFARFAPVAGIRAGDRVLSGANPMHDLNLYQVLYALADLTGEKRYAAEADAALRWFFQHCQSPATGLLAWGEHMGWDFRTERMAGRNTHEYYRPWVLWDRSFQLAPKACLTFARGVWDHQIGDPKTGNFSRHARYDRHGPGTGSEYPRHGGFYITTWAAAYAHSKDPVFLKAIDTLLTYFHTRRSPASGAIPAESHPRSKGNMMWPPSNLSLAIDCWDAAACVPADLAKKLRDSAAKTDRVFLRIPQDLAPGSGRGFAVGANTHTLGPHTKGGWRGTQTWATRYGSYTDAQVAILCSLRYRQVKLAGYRKLILDTAARYLTSQPDAGRPVYPGALGDAVWLMLTAHDLTGQAKYLARADRFATLAVGMFLDSDSPLPKASTKNNHYEAITRADTLMMALLKLWQRQNKPRAKVRLIYSDR